MAPKSTSTTQSDAAKKLLLLDGHSLAFRAFYALKPENFSTTGGQYTNAVYGFIGMVLTLLEKEKPTHVAAAFDLSGPTFRSEKLPEYKAQRPKTPEEFANQIELIREVLDAMGIVTIDKEKYEADDIIATLATQGQKQGFDTYICTGDRDSFQLVSDKVTVLYTLKGVSNLARFTPAAVEEKYGVTPEQYPDLAALRGDTSDNMPGVPGVGPKTAQKWMNQYGSLSELIEKMDDIGGKVGENLRSHISDVILARDITEMVKDLPLSHQLDELVPRQAEADDINAIFDKLQFGSQLRRRVMRVLKIADSQPRQTTIANRRVLRPGEALQPWFDDMVQSATDDFTAGTTAVMYLAAAGNSDPAGPSCSALALCNGTSTLLLDPEELDDTQRTQLEQWLSDRNAPKVVHDAKATYHVLAGAGFELNGVAHDTAMGAYLLRPELRDVSIDAVVTTILGSSLETSSDHVDIAGAVVGESDESQAPSDNGGDSSAHSGAAGDQLSMLDLPDDSDSSTRTHGQSEKNGGSTSAAQTSPHILRDSDVQLVHAVEILPTLVADEVAQLTKDELYSLYENIEVPLTLILARMEHQGIAVDRQRLETAKAEADELVEQEIAAARELVDRPELNLASPKQLQEVLFDQLELPKTKKVKTGYSTAAKEIEQLNSEHPHPFLQHLLDFREYQKRATTLEGLRKAIAEDGRIHTTFKQTATTTGRLSSTEPNLQNIPVRTAEGRRIRSAFTAGDGFTELLTADYSQIEMRVMAHLSGDEGLIQAYASGEDLHNYVGSQVFGVGIDEVTPELRRRVKALSYGLAYGLSEYGLSQQLDISVHEARNIRDSYFERFGNVKQYLEAVVEKAKEDGFTSTLFGRRRYLADLNSTNRMARENAERAALNSPIQGTAADIIKVAMIRIDEAMRRYQPALKSRMLLQVHDELILELAPGEEDTVTDLVQQHMDAAIELSVPLEVSIGRGKDWDSAAH